MTTESSRSDDRTELTAAAIARAEAKRAREAKLEAKREAAATEKAIRNADKMWATTDLNIWSESGKDAKKLGLIEAAHKVLVTGREDKGRSEVAIDGEARWVTSGYFSAEKPVAAAAGLSMAPCPDGSVESGLTSDAVYVYRSVCNAFPQITSYGGWDAHGEHSSGRAIDIMTSDAGARHRDRGLPPLPRGRAEPLRHHLAPAHLDARAVQRRLALHVVAWLGDCRPLRPRARCGQLTSISI